MKKIYIVLLIILSSVSFTSCLKSGLEDNLPRYADAFMTDVFMEYRFEDPAATSGGSPVVRIVNLPVSGKQFKRKETTGSPVDSAVFTVTVPAASGTFTTAERAKVSQGNLVFYCNISTAATMQAASDAPLPGIPGDFNQPRTYTVTAADGTSRNWVVRIASFVK